MKTPRVMVIAAIATAAVALAGCSSGSDPLAGKTDDSSSGNTSGGASSETIVVGSQTYYSNEIIAEIYAQALEAKGYKVEKKFNAGQRDAYMPDVKSGKISLFPEYTGNLLQWLKKDATATESKAVYDELKQAMPEGTTILDQAAATDQDTYTVTAKFAKDNGVASIADLSKVSSVTLGGSPELQKRPYGPDGAKKFYGLDLKFSPTADTTVDELLAGSIQVADVFSADPRIKTDDLVVLEDPKNMLLASHVVPIVNTKIADKIAGVINPISAKLSDDELRSLNLQSVKDKKEPAAIAKAWLQAQGLI